MSSIRDAAKFGERLRSLRTAAGLTQKALGTSLSGEVVVSESHISLIEKGRRLPSNEVLAMLADRLGCSTTRLIDDRPSEQEERIALELAYARLAIEHGEALEARTRLEHLLSDDPDGMRQRTLDDVNWELARAYDRTGDTPKAAALFAALVDRALKQQTHIPVTLAGLALVSCYLEAGDLHHATSTGERALEAAREQNLAGTVDYFRLAATVMAAYMGLGDFLTANLWAEQFLAEAAKTGQSSGEGAIYWNAALVAEADGRLADARRLCDHALGLYGEADTERDTPRLMTEAARLLMASEPPLTSRAAGLLEQAHDTLIDLGSRVDRGVWHTVHSTVRLHEDTPDVPGAIDEARQAVRLTEGAPLEHTRALMTLVDALAAEGHDTEAEEALDLAYRELATSARTRMTAIDWRELAERRIFLGQADQALTACWEALKAAGVPSRTQYRLPQVRKLRDRPTVPVTAGH